MASYFDRILKEAQLSKLPVDVLRLFDAGLDDGDTWPLPVVG
jgi:hypothetical protein